jgi:hypothetical protein
VLDVTANRDVIRHVSWQEKGWVHLRGVFTPAEIGRVNALIDRLWTSKPRSVTVDDVDLNRRTRFSSLPDSSRPHRVKIADLYLRFPEIRELLLAPPLTQFLQSILGDTPVLCNSLNMEHGSAQDFHADSIFMTPLTPGGLAATWIALEDVKPGSGPLRFYPGSHLIPAYRFSNGSTHAIDSELAQWGESMQRELDARGLKIETVYPKSGDVIVWHSDLIHGAEPISDPTLTRKSLVGHYFPLRDVRKRGERIVGKDACWIQRRPQPVDLPTRVLSAIERRVNRVRAKLSK